MGKERRTNVKTSQGKKHFSHPHILKPLNPAQSQTLTCNACEQQNNNNSNFHGCDSCQYFLHENCLNAPRFLDHSSHPSHHLTLIPIPTYSNNSYTCKACGSTGNGFNFSCAPCEFDIHLQCALLPQTILLPQHHHDLELIFDSPLDHEDEHAIFVCDVCQGEVGHNYWLYYCAYCDFGTHLECGTAKSAFNQNKRESINKPIANPVVMVKSKVGKPIMKQETNQEEEEEVEDTEEEEENEEEEEEEDEIEEEEEDEEEEEEEEEIEDTEEEEEEEEDEKKEHQIPRSIPVDEEEEKEDEDEKKELKIPKSVLVDEHPHKLKLYYGSPYEDDTEFDCDICKEMMHKDDWLYYCAKCDYGSHLQCASPGIKVPRRQQRSNPVNRTVEMINAANDAHDALMAAQMEAMISARSRQNMLDLIDGPSRRRYDYY